jgi:TonB family protein
MRVSFAGGLLLVALATAAPLPAQDTAPTAAPAPTQLADTATTPPSVIQTVSPEVNPAELGPGHLLPFEGTCVVRLMLDENGVPQDVKVIQSLGPELDAAAVKAVQKYRFKPAMKHGQPVAVPMTIKVDFHIGPPRGSAQFPAGKHNSGIIQPKVIHSVDAQFTEYARQNHIHGSCLVALIVDVDGNPQDVHIVRSLEPSLDASALDAVRQWKFRPATKEGVPVAVPMSVSVNFTRF